MLFTVITAAGIYIKSKLSLCHDPSYEMTVSANSFLSNSTNSTKQAIEIIKQIIPVFPMTGSLFLNESIPKIRRTNVSS